MSEFDRWNEIKKRVDKIHREISIKPREIYWARLGKNIGNETDGKNYEFVRAILIIKRLTKDIFIGVPLSTKLKEGSYFYNFSYNYKEKEIKVSALLLQIRSFSVKRLLNKIGYIKKEDFSFLLKKYKQILPPSTDKDGVCLTANSYKTIIPQKTQNVKTIWFDLVTPKSVLFFSSIIKEIQKKCNVLITTRGGEGYKETTELLDLYEFNYHCIGNFGGGELKDKLHASISRQFQFLDYISHQNISKLVCLSSVDAVRVAFGLGIPVYNFYDIPLSDHKTNFKRALPQARLTIPLATKMFKPFVVPDEVILRFGLDKEQIVEYGFIDPLIWLDNFEFDKEYVSKLYKKYGIDRKKFTILVREEEYKACYVDKKYPFLYEALPKIYEKFDANIILIPRYESEYLKKEFPFAYVIEEKIFLQHLLKDVDLFIGGGGTINTESCFLGTPTISTRSFISHYDKWQIDNNLMVWTNKKSELMNYVKLAMQNKLTPNRDILNEIKVDLDMIVKNIL
jgi:predicted glycosyltransferase/tetrahydromethanopterin S-methyltransferase subunit G